MPSHLSSGKPYTRTDVKVIRILAKRKQSAAYAARILGRTRGGVAFKAMVLGISFHSINQPAGVQKKRFRKRR